MKGLLLAVATAGGGVFSDAIPADAAAWNEPLSGATYVRVEGGCFLMGSARGEPDERPRHEACVETFWMMGREVSQAHWLRLFDENPSEWQATTGHPVEMVSWNDALRFADRLTSRSKGGATFRLPTEAEWEYACRGGAEGFEASSAIDLELRAWVKNNTWPSRSRPGEERVPTAPGLHDLAGSVHEWVADGYLENGYLAHDLHDPFSDSDDGRKVLRGGSYLSRPEDARCASRNWLDAGDRLPTVGFRLVVDRPPGLVAQP